MVIAFVPVHADALFRSSVVISSFNFSDRRPGFVMLFKIRICVVLKA